MPLAVKMQSPNSQSDVDAQTHFAVVKFVSRCAWLIDENRLEEMLEMFAESATYQVLPLENLQAGLPSALMRCSSRNMLRDRILGLREATVFNVHSDRHILGWPQIDRGDVSGEYKVKTPFSCYQTDQEGVTALFAVGFYDDIIRINDDMGSFLSRTVILDTYSVPSLIGVPL